MAFESLTEKLSNAFKRLRGKGKLSPADVKDAMREVKLALLEADVNFKVVKEFVGRVSERAVGAEVLESLTPAQQVIKIVNEEMCAIMGGSQSKLSVSPKPPTVIMMVGLQGSGKTTHCGKLGGLLKSEGKRPLLAACDIYRPAAVKQLQVVGEKVGVPVFTLPQGTPADKIACGAVEHAIRHGNDYVIIDTAGRLHIDEELMAELDAVKAAVKPIEILLVVDAMMGQDAVNVASTFNEKLDITGVILTKADGDTRGGAALSVRYVTGKPIKFIGMGEKLSEIEPFHPERIASRILGMGDVLTLIEKAQTSIDEKKAIEMEKKMRTQSMGLDDFLDLMHQMKKMGPMDQMLSMMPGMNQAALKDVKVDDKQMERTEAIILSMTPGERQKPDIINSGRKMRIARGSGVKVEDVNKLLKQFDQMRVMMKRLSGAGGKKAMKRGRFGGMPFM